MSATLQSRKLPTTLAYRQRERGLVLVVGLVILLILTLISVTAMRGTSLEEHMAGNLQYRNQAFQLAEAALREGEQQVRNGPPSPGDNGYCNLPPDPAAPRWEKFYGAGVAPPATTAGGCTPVCAHFDSSIGCSDGTKVGASYLIEKVTSTPMASDKPMTQTNDYYQVTAEGVGPNGKTVVVLQSTYKL